MKSKLLAYTKANKVKNDALSDKLFDNISKRVFPNEYQNTQDAQDKLRAPSKSVLDEATYETARYQTQNPSDQRPLDDIIAYNQYKFN